MSQPLAEPPIAAPEPLSAALEQTSHLARTAFTVWADESCRFLDGMARDGAQALDDLNACRTPLEAAFVEHKWLMARTQACIDTGFRIMAEMLLEPEQAVAQTACFRLPD